LQARLAVVEDRPVITRPARAEAPTEPAGYFTRRRGAAWMVDAAVVVGLAAGVATVLGVDTAEEGSVLDWLATTRGVGLSLLLGFLYLGLVPARTGQSLGKLLVGLRVTRKDGGPAGRARLLARALLDMATVGVFLFVANTFVPDDAGPRATPTIVAILVTPCLLIAWVVRDGLLDLRLSRRV
jgi:uncharacterized RDD family membrane protein YckC